MLGKCFFIICVISVVCAVITGNLPNLSNAVIDGATASVELTLTLAGNMCLWCGIMEVLRSAGAIEKFSRILSPILRHVFPSAWQTGIAREEITASISANILGIGNAATPFA
ncbi:MAG: spore maturation protein A, partial [Clostridia bacterium]|nr:spore maturation protein A [Clostridia bacterium]